MVNLLGVHSEFQVSVDDIPIARMTEYIQSVLVSAPNHYVKNNETDPSEKFFSIQKDVENLYQLIQDFYICWGLNLKD